MTKRKTCDLEGALLDAAVALALGADARIAEGPTGDPLCFARGAPGGPEHGPTWKSEVPFCPSQSWGDGGEIIERERITITQENGVWGAYVLVEWAYGEMDSDHGDGSGPTPLIAAMRAYVASRFGDEVEML